MRNQKIILLAVTLLLAGVFLVVPVAADTIVVDAGNGQSATAGTSVSIPLRVLATYSNGTPISGIQIIFTPNTGSGVIVGSPATTDADGKATISSWTLSSTAGTNTVIATSDAVPGSSATFTATGTTAVSYPTIASITPSYAANSGWQTLDIVGTNFSASAAVTLTKSGQSTITGATTATADTTTTVSRNFNLNGVSAGTWNLVILNSDGGSVTGTFTVNTASAATVTSISPTSGTVNTSVSTTIVGTGFVPASAKIRLYRSGNYIGGTVNSGGSTTQLTGAFNLNQATPGTYDVCVLADGSETSKVCSPTFTILSATAANGTIYFTSTPSGAVVYVDSVKQGNTPFTMYNLTPGSYTVKMQRASYLDWADRVTVTAGNQTTVTAKMTAIDTSTTVPTTAPVVITTAVVPTKTVKSTAKVPTAYPTSTATPASPVDVLVIVGAVGLGIAAIRK